MQMAQAQSFLNLMVNQERLRLLIQSFQKMLLLKLNQKRNMKKFIALTLALFLYTVSTLNSNVINQFWVPSVYKGDGQFEHPKVRTPLLTPIQLDCMAKNIYFEAAVESTAGKMAVAHVTLNRVNSKRFPTTVCGVVKQGKHYANGIPVRDR